MILAFANYIFCSVCILIVLAAGGSRLFAGSKAISLRTLAIPVFLVLAAAAARLYVPPAFIHSNLHGYNLMNSILDFPNPSLFRAEFGQGSFLTLGLASRLFGGGWEAIVHANIGFSAGILACAAVLAWRIGGITAACAAVAAGIFWPPLVRVACSEDAHNAAVFFGMLSVAAADGARRRGGLEPASALLISASCALAFFSRQSMFFLPALSWALILPLRPWKDHPRMVAAAAATTIAVYAWMAVSLGTTNDALAVSLLKEILFHGRPSILVLRHPLLHFPESLAILVFLAIGTVQAVRSREHTAVCLAAAATVAGMSSIGLSVFNLPQLEYGMRMPLFGLILPLAGMGVSHCVEIVRARLHSDFAANAAAVAAVAACALLPAREYREMHSVTNLQEQEYRIIRRNIDSIHPDKLRVPPADSALQPSYAPPYAAFGAKKGRIRELSKNETRPVTVFAGLQCYAYSLEELAGDRRREFSAKIPRLISSGAFLGEKDEALRLSGLEAPAGRRQGCEDVARIANRFEHWGTITVYEDDLPFVYYSGRVIPVGVWVLDKPPKDN
jgi:hypothetical protein